MPLNFEFKARTGKLPALEALLLPLQPVYMGEDHQCDTYFHAAHGRLKLREGRIENALIHYHRSNTAGAKASEVLLYTLQPDPALKAVLAQALGIKTVVEKSRRIYFIDNVKFHFDTVKGLGTFVEVEAIDREHNIGISRLQEQCSFYATLFRLAPEDYIAASYSDLLLAKNNAF